MSDVIKASTVLDLGAVGPHLATFGYHHWDIGHVPVANSIDLPRKAWEDLGSPDQITVTIEPRDRLSIDGDVITDRIESRS